jgi:hypothetical protein
MIKLVDESRCTAFERLLLTLLSIGATFGVQQWKFDPSMEQDEALSKITVSNTVFKFDPNGALLAAETIK